MMAPATMTPASGAAVARARRPAIEGGQKSGGILARIVSDKKEAVAAAARRTDPARLRETGMASAPGRRGFYNALFRPGPAGANIIAEIKRASPSKGLIRPDMDAARQARAYEEGGAAAISVLTDGPYFRGSDADLTAARSAAGLPILRKDFIISEFQIIESAALGADAVLLIVRILSPDQLRDYLALCEAFGLDALVETHLPEEIDTALSAGARLIGINNRNLQSFETDLDTAISMIHRIGDRAVAVAESGISGRPDIIRLAEAGFFNFLVGESLARADDPADFLKILRGVWP